MEVQEVIEFDGVKYRLMGTRRYYLSQSNTNKGRKSPKGLHVAIWEFHTKKEVPTGFHIHHKDGNTFNNDIENLECISREQHDKIPKKINMELLREHLEKIRPLTKAWHSTEEGKKFHKRIAGMSYKYREKFIIKCLSCRSDVSTYYPQKTKYCGNRCSLRALRARRLQSENR